MDDDDDDDDEGCCCSDCDGDDGSAISAKARDVLNRFTRQII